MSQHCSLNEDLELVQQESFIIFWNVVSQRMPRRGVLGAGGLRVRRWRVRAVAEVRGRLLHPELGGEGQRLRPGRGPRPPAQGQQLQRWRRPRPRGTLLCLLVPARTRISCVQPQRGAQQLLLHQHQLHWISADEKICLFRYMRVLSMLFSFIFQRHWSYWRVSFSSTHQILIVYLYVSVRALSIIGVIYYDVSTYWGISFSQSIGTPVTEII